jgi:phosphoserine aminotransferase
MNFGAGPGALPLEVLEEVAAELGDIAGTGMGVLEHSHRGAFFEGVLAETLTLLRELTGLPDSHEILLMQGGASLQFGLVPMNLLREGARAGYVVGGAWGEKALDEGKRAAALVGGEATLLASSEESGRYVRPVVDVPDARGLAYVHFTSNETIHGIEYDLPSGVATPMPKGVACVCDASSNFLARPYAYAGFDLVYAGAQKNIGPAGLVVVFVKKSMLAEHTPKLPNILRYDQHAKSGSLLNTPPTLSIEITRRVLRWLRAKGGLAAIGAQNARKAQLLYGTIDAFPSVYRAPVTSGARSEMNAVFHFVRAEDQAVFLEQAARAGFVGLAGHRSAGGMRVSMYNAVPLAWVEALCDFMRTFAAARA